MNINDTSNNETGLEIAVIGMAGRFPGAPDINRFWENLKNGVESITFFTDDQLQAAGVDPQWLENPDYVKAKGVLTDIEYFDAAFFDVSPREAEVMDPQLRLFFQCAWHGLEDLRYKMWWPAGHFGVSVSDRDREKILDPDRPLTEKFQGITHYVIENVGGPCAEKIAISFMTPEDLGFDMDRFKSPAVGTVVGANGVSLMLDPPPGVPARKSPATMVHFVREIDGGVEFRPRFWMAI